MSCCEGHKRWLSRTASADEYAPFGVELSSDGHFHLLSCPFVATDEATGDEADAAAEGDPCLKQHPRRLRDVTEVIDAAVGRLRDTTTSALTTWRQNADRFLATAPEAAEELQHPAAPSKDSFVPGVAVEVLWPPDAPPNGAGQGGVKWLPATVVSVHADGRHVVRFDHGGSWGDTERGVLRRRLRLGAKNFQLGTSGVRNWLGQTIGMSNKECLNGCMSGLCVALAGSNNDVKANGRLPSTEHTHERCCSKKRCM